MMPDWLSLFLKSIPATLWFFAGIGIPCALALLPRRDWQDRPTVIGLGLALGPIFGTTWLFLLGTVWRFELVAVWLGTLIIAATASSIVYWRYKHESPPQKPLPALPEPAFKSLKIVLILMMGLALLASAWDTAFWPFTRYDSLWTFAYNAKIFMLEKQIPAFIDYYPQLVPLSFTFSTLSVGEFNDHAARAAVPFFLLGTVYAAYLLGWRVYQKRLTGYLSAALWLLLPSGLVWSSAGDLEHPMTLYFTMASIFFALAWREDSLTDKAPARYALESNTLRYAAISGLMIGAAMWTKPTAGALVLGIGFSMLMAAIYSYQQQKWAWFWRKFKIAFISLSVAAPLGGMWYIRNLLAGHAWTNLPPKYWQSFAQRSGMQLHWLWGMAAIVTLILLYQAWRRSQRRWQDYVMPITALAFLSIGILPTALSIPADGWTQATSWGWINGFREAERRLNSIEGIFILLGTLLLLYSGWKTWQKQAWQLQQGFLITWGIGLPFFVVYFWSFSYHYRLALSVMPVIFAPLAALLGSYLIPILLQNRLRQAAMLIITVALSLPAPLAATYHTALNTLNDTGLDTDSKKYAYANPALMQLVAFLERYAADNEQSRLKVSIPGENRVAFFFPTWQIDDETLPTDLEDLAGYDLFINYAANFLWETEKLIPNQVWAWSKLAWVYPLQEWDQVWAFDGPYGAAMPRVLKPAVQIIDDGKDHYEAFSIHLDAATQTFEPETPMQGIVFGDGVQFLGFDLPSTTFVAGEKFTLKLYWQGTENGPLRGDYSIFVHLRDAATGEVIDQIDGGLMYGLFPMRLLTPGMFFQDRREWQLKADLPLGKAELWIGVYDPIAQTRLPVTMNNVPIGDSILIEASIIIE